MQFDVGQSSIPNGEPSSKKPPSRTLFLQCSGKKHTWPNLLMLRSHKHRSISWLSSSSSISAVWKVIGNLRKTAFRCSRAGIKYGTTLGCAGLPLMSTPTTKSGYASPSAATSSTCRSAASAEETFPRSMLSSMPTSITKPKRSIAYDRNSSTASLTVSKYCAFVVYSPSQACPPALLELPPSCRWSCLGEVRSSKYRQPSAAKVSKT
mmetsp:Transcript_10668/g.22024  ORF Transcript_10668/g.22024 Transcript_10668/m.22024 type:complete len:208 (+) Transcript_10668:118-741(+)